MRQIMRFGALVFLTLREIFEESAYARYLARHHVTSSRENYRAFLREQEAVRARRPRCC